MFKTPYHVRLAREHPRYTAERERAGGMFLNPAGRRIRAKGHQANEHLPNVEQALKSPKIFHMDTEQHRLTWQALGEPFASGVFGEAYRITNTGKAAEWLSMVQSSAWIFNKPVPAGATVVVKVFNDMPTVADFDLDTEAIREATYHRFLSQAPCVRVPGVNTNTCPSAFVPEMYWAAKMQSKNKFFVTVMELASGITVRDYIRAHGLVAKQYVAIEKAVTMLWIHGLTHSDLHTGNILFDATINKATIIDFGMVVKLTPQLTAKVRETLGPAIQEGIRSLGELWLDPNKSKFGLGIQTYSNRVRWTRDQGQITWFNPDGYSLRKLYNRMDSYERSRVPELRRQAWGVSANNKSPAKTPAKTSPVRAKTPRAKTPRAKTPRAKTPTGGGKPCPPGKIRSLKGRCVDMDGPTGRKLRGLPPLKTKKDVAKKECTAKQLRNPVTGRCNDDYALCYTKGGLKGKWGPEVVQLCRNRFGSAGRKSAGRKTARRARGGGQTPYHTPRSVVMSTTW